MDQPQRAMDMLKSEQERGAVSLFGDRLHIITDDDGGSGGARHYATAGGGTGCACSRRAKGVSRWKTYSSAWWRRPGEGQDRLRKIERRNMRRILAQARKELTQMLRDRMALGLALVLPVMQLMLKTTSISLTVKDLPIAVQDLDDSPASQRLWMRSGRSMSFTYSLWLRTGLRRQSFTSNKARAALIIPERFRTGMARGANTPVQMLIDASDSNTAQADWRVRVARSRARAMRRTGRQRGRSR